MLIEKMLSRGIEFVLSGEELIVASDMPLTDEQRDFIRQHKHQIMAELKASNESGPANRLHALAPKYRLDPDELVNWYRNDLDMIGGMDDNTLDALVRDYAANRDTFLGKQPYQSYRMWLYRLEPDSDQLRQGLMTDDLKEVQRKLAAIYGNPVFDLHKITDEVKNDKKTT